MPLETRSHPFAISRCINAVDLRTFGGVADSLENGCLPRICSSNNEDSELYLAGLWEFLLCGHSVEVHC
jgi:hypothetical protein